MRRVVYTCLFGYSELFNDFRYERDGIDFVCFTDDPELRSDFWKIELLPRRALDPARAAKKIKALPHVYLAQYDCSLYIDNTVRLKAAPSRLFEEYLAPAKSPLLCFRHPERDCVYDEAKVVLSIGFDTPERVNPQMALYRHLGYPAHNGLTKSALLLRRHQNPALQRVMDTWQEQVFCHSKRDQLSLLPACWLKISNPNTSPSGSTPMTCWIGRSSGMICACPETSTTLYTSNSIPIWRRSLWILASTICCGDKTNTGNTGASTSPTPPRRRFWVLRRIKQRSFLRKL